MKLPLYRLMKSHAPPSFKSTKCRKSDCERQKAAAITSSHKMVLMPTKKLAYEKISIKRAYEYRGFLFNGVIYEECTILPLIISPALLRLCEY